MSPNRLTAGPPKALWPRLYALLLVLAAPLHAADPATTQYHESALAAARRGEYDMALTRLSRLVRRHPGEKAFLHDYISVLQRAGRHGDALQLLPRIDRGRDPAFVLESLGAAATVGGRYELATELYLGILRRYPGRAESLRGLAEAIGARCLAAGSVPGDAIAALTPLPAAQRADVLHQAASMLEAKALYYAALHLTLDALGAQPAHRAAQATRIRIAARLGAAHLALQAARAHPDAVEVAQLDTLRRHAAAMDGRWAGTLHALPHQQRHGDALLDAAIAQSDALAARFLGGRSALTEAELKWLHDRLVLLGRRNRAHDVDTLYRAFLINKLSLPAYALAAAAEAQLHLRRPRQSMALYAQVLRDQPADADARVGMYYALLEAEEHQRATAWADAWAADTAPAPGTPPAPVDKAQHWGARVLQARARQFSGQPSRAQAGLDRLAALAPANPDVRAGLASVYRARGWPRRAWETWQIQLLHDPEDVDAYAESTGPLIDTHRFRRAHLQLQEARRRVPAALSVARAERAWHLHNRPELLLTMGAGRSSDANTPDGGKDRRTDATLYSPPLAERYRAFVHAAYLHGDLPAASTRYRRAGAGLEYRVPDLRLTGEWHTGWRDDGGTGLRLGARWWIDDMWNIAIDGDTRSTELPLQARGAGLDARRAALEIEVRLHESRAFAAGLSAMEFSDGNNRQSALLSWREGWLARPRHWLDSRADLYTSRNSREGAPYFNPRSDASASVSLTGGWRTWRWYERAFAQELTLTAGRYWQRDFAAGPLWGIEYAHRWDLDERFYLRYGIGRALHPYDGQQSGRSYLSLDLDWRF